MSDALAQSSAVGRVAYPLGLALGLLGDRSRALSLISRAHRTARVEGLRRRCEAGVATLLPTAHVASTHPTDSIEEALGRRILVLKERGDSEKGVVLVMFTELLAALAQQVDLRRLLSDYTLVLEPSWSGYFDRDLLFFTQFDEPIFVLAAEEGDSQFLRNLGSNLIPVPLGPCDWVDPSIAEPYLGIPKEYDLVMNSHWGPSKRHHVLFRSLAELGTDYRVALIGGSWEGGTREGIEALARHFGVREQLEMFERIPFARVMEITCRARVSVLLSLKEGSNRALAESMFCDVPAILLASHVGGIRKNIVSETGMMVSESELTSTIEQMVRSADRFSPRAWALDNISCTISSEKLNALLRTTALDRGDSWERDIAPRANSPELKYVWEDDARRLAPANEALRAYLK